MNLLTALANKYGSDKGDAVGFNSHSLPHNFTEIYNRYFFSRRLQVKKVLELGVYHGASLRMWRDYFPHAHIYGFDVEPSFMFVEDRISTHLCNQVDIGNIEIFINRYGGDFDLIIDDGDHDTVAQQKTLGIFFRYLKSGGIYIIEDLHASLGEMGRHMLRHNLHEKHKFTAYNTMMRFAHDRYLETDYISISDIQYIVQNTEYVEVCDTRGDQKSITSVIVKK